MIKDLVNLFGKAYEQQEDKLILDWYKPKEGLYIKIHPDREPESLVIKKKQDDMELEHPLYQWFKVRDYYSILFDMNKPVDPGKKIHSNNFLTLFIKRDIFPQVGETPLSTEEINKSIEQYFELLEDPAKKFKGTKEVKKMLEEYFAEKFHPVNVDRIRQNGEYLLKHMEELIALVKSSEISKGYVKVFFDAPEEEYRRELEKFIIPRVFNKNDYNEMIDGRMTGLSNSNMGTNSKKPFLELKTMKCRIPYRITVEEAVLTQKFFDWLMAQPNWEIYVPPEFAFDRSTPEKQENKPLYSIYATKGKEAVVEDFDYIPSYSSQTKFELQNAAEISKEIAGERFIEDIKIIITLEALQSITSKYFFADKMKGYFKNTIPDIVEGKFTKTMQSLFAISREGFFNYFSLGIDLQLKGLIDKVSSQLIREQLLYTVEGTGTERFKEVRRAFNLRISYLDYFFKEEGKMGMGDRITQMNKTWKEKLFSQETEVVACENDEEFYFMCGQLARYLASQSESKDKNFDLIEPFLRANNGDQFKKKLQQLFNAYKHKISMNNYRFSRAFGAVQGYAPNSDAKEFMDMFYAGLMIDNIMYTKAEKKSTEGRKGDEDADE